MFPPSGGPSSVPTASTCCLSQAWAGSDSRERCQMRWTGTGAIGIGSGKCWISWWSLAVRQEQVARDLHRDPVVKRVDDGSELRDGRPAARPVNRRQTLLQELLQGEAARAESGMAPSLLMASWVIPILSEALTWLRSPSVRASDGFTARMSKLPVIHWIRPSART